MGCDRRPGTPVEDRHGRRSCVAAWSDALLAPAWVPWSARLQAGDLGIGDVLPTAVDDERLMPGYAAVGPHDLTEEPETIDALIDELWLGRVRVLSEVGRYEAAERWYDGEHGPQAPIARAAELACASCGFMVLMRGALSRVFGICANEFAPDDGRVVSFDHGCGAHSEALVVQTEPLPTLTVLTLRLPTLRPPTSRPRMSRSPTSSLPTLRSLTLRPTPMTSPPKSPTKTARTERSVRHCRRPGRRAGRLAGIAGALSRRRRTPRKTSFSVAIATGS